MNQDKGKIITKENFIEKLKNSDRFKSISTLIGAIIVSLMTGSIFGFCTLSVYQISYIKGKDPHNFISIDHISFYYPFEVIAQTSSSFFSGRLEKKISLHFINLIGFTIYALGYFIMYLSQNFFSDLFAMVICGIGNGIIYYPSTINVCLWFPKNNGIIMGIIETTISLGSFFFALIGEQIINKNEIESDEDEDLYEYDVAIKVKKYLLFQIITILVAMVLSYLLIYEKENEEKEKKEKKTENPVELGTKIEGIEEVFLGTDTPIKSISKEEENAKESKNIDISDKDVNKKMFWTAFKSKRYLLFVAISTCFAQGPSMLFSLYRGIGETQKIDTGTLQLLGSVNFIFECASGFLIGILCDYVNLKILLIIIVGTFTIIMYIYCLTFTSDSAFFWITNISVFINGGIYPFADCYLMKVFGADIYIELIGISSFISNFVVVLFSPIAYYVDSNVEDKKAYWILFSLFGTLNFVSFILSFFINVEKFNFEERLTQDKIKTNLNELPEEPSYENN